MVMLTNTLTCLAVVEVCSQEPHMHRVLSAPNPLMSLQHLQRPLVLLLQIVQLQSVGTWIIWATHFRHKKLSSVDVGDKRYWATRNRRRTPRKQKDTQEKHWQEEIHRAQSLATFSTSFRAGMSRRDKAGDTAAAAARRESSSSLPRLLALDRGLGGSRTLMFSLSWCKFSCDIETVFEWLVSPHN